VAIQQLLAGNPIVKKKWGRRIPINKMGQYSDRSTDENGSEEEIP
jgi:hypothetical protein